MSGKLPDAWLEELRSRNSLEGVAAEYLPFKQKGRRLWACCPFHSEKTASFSIDPENQMYYCFGCHKAGTVIQFVEEMERLDFMEAVRYLADRAHMEVPERSADPAQKHADKNERERIYEANRLAARYFHALLWTGEGADALNYLYKRGLTDADIRRFGLGASPKGRDSLTKDLISQGFDEKTLISAGLTVRKDEGLRDMFRNRPMFPIIDAQGHVLGFGGRALGDVKPKYMNTSDTPVFNKRLGLYAMNFVKKERGLKRLVLVEGYMDTISLRKSGIEGVVATLGTALTQEQAHLMRRYAPEVWISYDGDAAGQKAALRALDMFEAEGLPAKVLDYPAGMDPDDFVKANGKEGFEGLPRHSATDYRMIRARDGLDLSLQEDLTRYTMACCDILRRLQNPVEVENYVRRLSHETGYDHAILMRQIGATTAAAEPAVPKPRPKPAAKPQSESTRAEQALLALLGTGRIDAGMIHPDDFSDGIYRRLSEWLIQGRPAAAFLDTLTDDAERDIAAQAFNFSPLPEQREDAFKMAEDCIRVIRRQRLQTRMNQIKESIATADASQKAELYRQMGQITKEIENLSSQFY